MRTRWNLAVLAAVIPACSGTEDGTVVAGTDGGSAATPGFASGGAGAGSSMATGGQSAETRVIIEELCGDAGCACSNGLDDDDDGKVDGFDEECTGPFDDDEGSFATGIPGDNVDPKWQDCFFDGNSGAGDDGCRYHTECLTGIRDTSDDGCSVATACRDFCAPRTPNGCDCFGCCTVHTENGALDIAIGNECSLSNLSDERACPRCIKTSDCENRCGDCELCLGRTAADLPDHCGGPPNPDGGSPPPSYTCEGGYQACDTTADCPGSYYCSLGCCLAFLQ